jgi:hypothetical protein
MRKKLLAKKSHMDWSWILMVGFFILGIYNYIFGILGLVCMTAPMIHALRGHGKLHCSHYCPRGSLFGRFIPAISRNRPLPAAARKKWVRHLLLAVMMGMFILSLIHSGGKLDKIAFALFRLMAVSFLLGVSLGIIFKPRAWCQVCPMAHATTMIDSLKKRKAA